MKRLSFFAALLVGLGMAGSGFAQSAAQYIAAGNQYYAAKDYVKGAQYYKAATQMDPSSAAAFQGLGNCLYVQGNNSEALAAYEKALALSPNNAQLSSFVQGLRAKVGASAPARPAATSPAATKSVVSNNTSSGSNKSFELAPMAGVGIAMGSSGVTYGGASIASLGLGFGGGVRAGVRVDKNLMLGGTVAFYTFGASYNLSASGYNISFSDGISSLEVLGSVKYDVGSGQVRPYLLGGAGISDLMSSVSASVSGNGYNVPSTNFSASSIAPAIQVGGGIEFSAGENMDVFGEIKYEMVFGNGGTISSNGVNLNVINGSSFSYIPINVGMAFDL